MAKQFLEQLPKIPLGELPAGSSCMICLNTYGAQSAENGTIESPVRLPCTHHVGLECITIWLSADKTGKISCPYCRKSFLPVRPRPYRTIEDDGEEAAEREALREIRMRRGRTGGSAPVNGEENNRTGPPVAEPNLALDEVMKAFRLLILGIVLFIALTLLFKKISDLFSTP